jgi:hypothetical protein
MSSPNPPSLVLLFSLADNARTKLPDWYGDVCSQARNLCAQHERTGTLTLVARTDICNSYPAQVTNAAQVAAGTHPATYEARPTWDLQNAPAAIIRIQRGVFPLPGRPGPESRVCSSYQYSGPSPTGQYRTGQQSLLGGNFRSGPTVLAHATPNCGCYVRRTWHDQPTRPGCVTGTAARTATGLG